MVFNSFVFVFFFVSICFLLMLTNLASVKKYLHRHVSTVRHIILLCASYIFYGWWDWRFAFLMLGLSIIAYGCSLAYSNTNKKIYINIAVIAPLVVLGIFKYLNFFIDSFVALLGIQRVGTLNIILPVGISFYTFQSLSYSIDVYRGHIKAEKSFVKLALYIAFFPQLVAGPIVKATDFIPQLYEDRNIQLRNCEKGIQYFVFGLFKKIVIADNLAVCVDSVFKCASQYHAVSLIFAVIAYSIQIYCDFSGYSDMAIGCAKCLGYELQSNFNLPYISRNVSEFWKRWHISLSTWLMEYLYIPLGGNRRGIRRTYINLLLTMLIGGLWHGSNWTFVAWGTLHGAALCIHKVWMRLTKQGKTHASSFITNTISVLITYSFICFCWILFRAENFGMAWDVITGIFSWQNGIVYVSSWTLLAIVLVFVCTLFATMNAARTAQPVKGYYPEVDLRTIPGLTVFFITIGIILLLAYTGASPFIYFQF